MGAPAVLLQGIDVGDTSYWSWEWRDASAPAGLNAIAIAELRPVLEELADALPGVRPRESESDVPTLRRRLIGVNPGRERRGSHLRLASAGAGEAAGAGDAAQARALRAAAAMDRCLTGALSRPETESELMARLADVLLPADLIAQLISAQGSAAGYIDVAVLPAQSCARVPWELLRISRTDDTRLIEIARVTTLSPVLAREGTDVAQPRRARRPVRLIDPSTDHGMVVHPDSGPAWSAREGQLSFQGTVDRVWLSEHLPAASHFTYVGHVASGRDRAGRPEPALTALVLSTPSPTASTPARARGRQLFTARDALLGTMGTTDPDLERALAPRAARGREAAVLPRTGRQLWPMPSRVAIIACESGIDYLDVEPFGLVTAFLELGAEYVTATRWVMYTDRAIGFYASGATPLSTAALQIDELQDAQRHPDAVSSLSAWKRKRLRHWRADGSLETSPLTWGAFAIHRAGTDEPRAEAT